jgi:hypothetical protein
MKKQLAVLLVFACLECVPAHHGPTVAVVDDDAAAQHAAATPPAPRGPARPDASAAAGLSPLHVWASVLEDPERIGKPEEGPPLESRRLVHLCSLSGASMLCGMPGLYVVKDGAFVRDPSLEVGLPETDRFDPHSRTYVSNVFGHWPDDAWLSFTIDMPQEDLPDIASVFHSVYRWRGRSWSLVKTGIRGDRLFLSWGGGGAAVVSLEPGSPEHWIEGLGTRLGADAISPFKSEPPDGTKLSSPLTFANGSLAGLHHNTRDGSWRAFRWDGGAETARVDPLRADDGSDALITVLGLWGPSPVDLVAFGWQPQGPYLRHFDGQGWSPFRGPEGQEVVKSYVRDDAGRAWIVAAAGMAPQRRTLWSAATEGNWAPVPLPLECEPWEVTRNPDGAVWVACLGGEKHPNIGRFLLSTLEASRSVELDPFIQPPQPSRESVDPSASPFHVVAVRRNHRFSSCEWSTLRVCSAGGPALLCAPESVRVWRGGAFERDPTLDVGLPDSGCLRDVYGQWPDVWLVWTLPRSDRIYGWDGHRWSQRGSEFSRGQLRDVRLLRPGVGLVPLSLQAVDARTGKMSPFGEWDGAKAPCKKASLYSVLPFTDASIVSHWLCADDIHSVTRWSARATLSPDDRFVTEASSAIGSWRWASFDGASPNDVVGYGNEAATSSSPGHPYLAHFDGSRWSRLQPPPGSSLGSYVRVGDEAWATTTIEPPKSSLERSRESLWTSTRGGPWRRVPLPVDCNPHDLQRTSDGTVWLRCERPLGYRFDFDEAILSTLTPTRIYEMPP